VSAAGGFDEESAKNELLALARELFLREPIEKDKRYRAGWEDLHSLIVAVISAPGFRLEPDVWRSMLDEMTVRKQLDAADNE